MTWTDAPDASDVDVSTKQVEAAPAPWDVYRQLRERGPVVQVSPFGSVTSYAVMNYADVEAGLQDRRFSKDSRHMHTLGGSEGARQAGFVLSAQSRHLLNTDPPDHTRLRKLVSRAFTARRVSELRPRIQAIVDELLDSLDVSPEPDLIADFAYPLSITVICELLGVPSERRAEFRQWSTAATTPASPEQAAAGAAQLNAYLSEHIGQRRAELVSLTEGDAPDVLSAMILAHDEQDRLSDDELVGMAFLLLIAGHETTVGLIGFALLELDRRRDQRQLLLDDPTLIASAIEEVLRLQGPVQRSTFRIAVEDTPIAGTLIPAGSVVTLMIGAANHDPMLYANPEALDITRAERRHLAFGQGIHFCIGAPLARMEAQVAIGSLLIRYPDYQVTISDDSLTFQTSVIRALASLPVNLEAPQANS